MNTLKSFHYFFERRGAKYIQISDYNERVRAAGPTNPARHPISIGLRRAGFTRRTGSVSIAIGLGKVYRVWHFIYNTQAKRYNNYLTNSEKNPILIAMLALLFIRFGYYEEAHKAASNAQKFGSRSECWCVQVVFYFHVFDRIRIKCRPCV